MTRQKLTWKDVFEVFLGLLLLCATCAVLWGGMWLLWAAAHVLEPKPEPITHTPRSEHRSQSAGR